MSAVLAPQGLVPTRHPSGTIRVENLVDGILSGYTSNIFTGTPVKRFTDGTLNVCGTGADTCLGVFQGCEFSASGKRFVLPYFPAGQTYDAGSMIAKFTADSDIIFEAQADGPVAQIKLGEAINLANTTQGSVYTGFSSQALSATTTGATPGTFVVFGLAQYGDNAWGDAFTKLLVKIGTGQPPVAFAASAEGQAAKAAADEAAKAQEIANKRAEDDAKVAAERKAADAKLAADRRLEDARLTLERNIADEAAAVAQPLDAAAYARVVARRKEQDHALAESRAAEDALVKAMVPADPAAYPKLLEERKADDEQLAAARLATDQAAAAYRPV